jgi:DNA-binding MarR family transcriptional regulator
VRSKLMGRTLGVTGPQRLAMRVIEHAPGISAHELAARLRVHKSTLSGILQRLEARSVVTRHADPDDGRRRALVVTPAGLALLHRAAPTIEAEVTAVLGEFDPAEVEVVRRLLSRLAARLADPPDRPSASAAALASAGTTRRVPA